jgi:hypothetical protein
LGFELGKYKFWKLLMPFFYKYYGLFEDFLLKQISKYATDFKLKIMEVSKKYKKKEKTIYRLVLPISRSPKLITD